MPDDLGGAAVWLYCYKAKGRKPEAVSELHAVAAKAGDDFAFFVATGYWLSRMESVIAAMRPARVEELEYIRGIDPEMDAMTDKINAYFDEREKGKG